MNRLTLVASIAAMTAISATGCTSSRGANAPTTPPSTVAPSAAPSPTATSQGTSWHREGNKLVAPIKSRAGLTAYLRRQNGNSPLDALQPENRQLFVGSLFFTPKGRIASFNYASLKQLTPTQIYRILQLFGLQRFTAAVGSTNITTHADKLLAAPTANAKKAKYLKDYRCVGRPAGPGKPPVPLHTCKVAKGYLCTTNC